MNEAGAPAYALEAKHALAQYAVTGCFNRTYYAQAKEQVTRVLELCEKAGPDFVARLAVYARRDAFMKDMPTLLCAWLSKKEARLQEQVFARVIDSPKMLRNYVQILRSGVVGRRSLGSAPKRLVREWLAAQSEDSLFSGSVGQQPSLADVVKMVHPKPATACRKAFYGYLLQRPYEAAALPALVAKFERFKKGESLEVPELPFTMLSALPLSARDWVEIAKNASWQTTRMNLNTFALHGVFGDPRMARLIAKRLRSEQEVKRARVFPYQLFTAFTNVDATVPAEVKNALQDAMEIAIENVPKLEGRVVVCPDVSGSMSSPVTGHRQGATTSVRCIDVAALVAAAVLRKNRSASVLPFEYGVSEVALNPRDSVMTNAQKLAAIGGGGTNCSAPIRLLNTKGERADLVIFVSDNESWCDPPKSRGTELMREWSLFKKRNPQARLVCLDIQPYATTQAIEREDILNIGGFSDQVFELIAAFAAGRLDAGHWVGRIESVQLAPVA